MIGNGYWATGIVLTWYGDGRWSGEINYYDNGFCDDDPDHAEVSTEGTLRTRYVVRDGTHVDGLTAVIDTLIGDAARLGIDLRDPVGGRPYLYYRRDGEDVDYPPPPDWKALLAGQAARIGWRSPYARQATVDGGA